MKYNIVQNWNDCAITVPDDGVLCIVIKPVGVESQGNTCIGPSALAYYRNNEKRWVYADIPTQLKFIPYYWCSIDSLIGE